MHFFPHRQGFPAAVLSFLSKAFQQLPPEMCLIINFYKNKSLILLNVLVILEVYTS